MNRINQSEIFVEVEQLTKSYSKMNDFPAVSNISLSIRSGEILSLLGPNGAGKTTTVKMIAGLVLPTSGTAKVMGYDVVSERQKAVRHIGAVLEGARNLYWRLSAIENLRYFGNLRLVPPKELKNRTKKLLSMFDLTQHQHKEVGKFSRGMQQKLAIAVALLHDPDVLLLDEPTLGLDVKSARQLESAIVEFVKQKGKAVILTTHMMDLAEKLADTVYVIHQGRKVASGPTAELLHQYDYQKHITEIRVAGKVAHEIVTTILHSFAGASVSLDGEFSVILWPSVEQTELIKLLNFLNEQRVTLVNVGRRKATLEEVFLSLTEDNVNDVAIVEN